jgi:hypothetical protein
MLKFFEQFPEVAAVVSENLFSFRRDKPETVEAIVAGIGLRARWGERT